MSSIACLNQVSPYLLEQFKAYPVIVDLYFDTSRLKQRLKVGQDWWPIMQEFQEELAETYFWNDYQQLTAEQFKDVKPYLPLILSESRFPFFQLGTRSAVGGGWETLHILLAGSKDERLSFLTQQNPALGDRLLLNLIGGGQPIGHDLGYGRPRYFEPEQVIIIKKAMDTIKDDDFQQRWQAICQINSWTDNNMSDEDAADWAQFYGEMTAYIKAVLKQGDALVFSVG